MTFDRNIDIQVDKFLEIAGEAIGYIADRDYLHSRSWEAKNEQERTLCFFATKYIMWYWRGLVGQNSKLTVNMIGKRIGCRPGWFAKMRMGLHAKNEKSKIEMDKNGHYKFLRETEAVKKLSMIYDHLTENKAYSKENKPRLRAKD